jgi:signal transduction histidine kinase
VETETPLDVAGRVAAAAAHDFNNHVAAIALQAELALAAAAPEDEKLRRRLEGILGSCDAARGMTRSLLAFGGRRPLQPSRVDVAGAVERLAGPRVTVSVAGAPLVVEIDAGALDDALVGLTAGRQAAVSARRDGEVVELRFSRPGPGPDEVTRRRFFEPFAAEDRRLELAVVYGFVRQSGGTISLEPAPDGAAIVLRLPRAGD